MGAPSPAAVAKALRLLDEKTNILAGWNNPAMCLLFDRGHVTSAFVYMLNGRVAKSKLWTITPAGRAWRAGN